VEEKKACQREYEGLHDRQYCLPPDEKGKAAVKKYESSRPKQENAAGGKSIGEMSQVCKRQQFIETYKQPDTVKPEGEAGNLLYFGLQESAYLRRLGAR